VCRLLNGTTVYLYDGDGIVEATDQNGNETAKYVQGSGIDEPLAVSSGGASSKSHMWL
jgi:hypothetical protein